MRRQAFGHRVAGVAVAAGLQAICLLPAWAQTAGSHYELDMSWPKPMPERWVLGPLGGACVDGRDHMFLLHRQELIDVDLDAGQRAPAVIELDPSGTVVGSWSDSLFERPLITSFHTCHVDGDGNVWIVSTDAGMIQKFSRDGRLVQQIGPSKSVDSSDGTLKGKPLNSPAAHFFLPADVGVDRRNGDVYVADGDSRGGNRRVAVFDRDGRFLRQWQPESETLHCLTLSNDGLVYVCDRLRNRIQVYDTAGNLKQLIDVPWKPYTPSDGRKGGTSGTTVSMALSRDPEQRLMFVINQNNSQIDVLERRTGKMLTSFGRAGHFPGHFDQPLHVVTDSKGNVYVTENRGRRVQKFIPVNR